MTLTPAQMNKLSYLCKSSIPGFRPSLTTSEYDRLVIRLGSRLPLPRRPSDEAHVKRFISNEDQLEPVVSRHATRLLALVFTFGVVYENLLLGLLRRQKLSSILRSLRVSSSLRLASFVAGFSAVYRLVLSRLRPILPDYASDSEIDKGRQQLISLRRIRNKLLLSNALPPFLAALIASPVMLLEPRGQRRVTISVYALTRALHGLIVGAGKKRWLSQAMIEGRWWWGGHLVFALANGLLLHSFVYNPSTFPTAYSNFILRFSSAYLPARPAQLPTSAPWPTQKETVAAIAESSRLRWPAFVSPLIHPSAPRSFDNPILDKMTPILDRTHPGHSRLVCAFLHPDQTGCRSVASNFIIREAVSASKFFGALSLLGLLIRWKKSLRTPDESIYRALLSTTTSSLFLSLSLGTSWSMICALQHYLPNSFLKTKRFFVQGFLAALWVGLVGGQRATDLGLYASRTAIQCVWDTAVAKKKIKSIPHGDVIVFALSMSTLMALHDVSVPHSPSLRPSKLLKLFFFFCFTPQAHPASSNSAFVRGALNRIGGPSHAEEKARQLLLEEKKRRGSTNVYATNG
ncbi:BQ2448_1510 [Microbotryum intermedium]|uniref:BQ2448_1510 protein n=1 Tax=Microbotryum intermedium TaxID=269621 RepID=A0A238FGE7_9BASI|nr:BQ2448_1510 [Microbotryum intermedium]